LSNSNTLHIIIVNWNGLNDTLECLNSIKNQVDILPVIHLWDNNSENNELSRIKETFGYENIHYYPSETNLGFTQASNKLIQSILKKNQDSNLDYVALVNNDTILNKDCMSNLLDFARTHKGDVISCKMLQYNERNVVDNLGHKMLRTGEIVPALDHRDIDGEHTNFGSCGGGTLISTRCIEDLGFFDSYFNTGYEDAEFGLRAKLYGYKTLYCDSAIIYHKGGNSIKKIYNEEYAIKVQKDILFTICKLYPTPLLILILPFSILRNLFMGCLSVLLGKINYLKILLKASYQFITKDIKIALAARKRLKSKKKTINSLQLFSMQRSSLIFDGKDTFR